jgi:hypothetical protein
MRLALLRESLAILQWTSQDLKFLFMQRRHGLRILLRLKLRGLQ